MRAGQLGIVASVLAGSVAVTAFAQGAEPATAPPPVEFAPPAKVAEPSEPVDQAKPVDEARPVDQAASDDEEESGIQKNKFVIGGRLGYAIPMGESSDGYDLNWVIQAQIPIRIDVLYKILPNIQVGGFGQFGIGLLGDREARYCDTNNIDCYVWAMQGGVQGQYHLNPRGSVDPWFGMGLGLDFLTEAGDDGYKWTWSGAMVEFQAGLDLKPSRDIGFGPFVGFTFGRYSSVEVQSDSLGNGATWDITDPSIHEWLTLGARGTFNL